MLKRFIKWLFTDWVAAVLMIAGSILLALTLRYGVNPFEFTVVDEDILGTPLHYVLFITTVPAWIAGVVIGCSLLGWEGMFLPGLFMFIVQVLLYGFLGKAMRGLCWCVGKAVIRLFPSVIKGQCGKMDSR
ncbi:MAG: hypothetical protein ACYS83_02335 [Planctomycetota bacterium]